ncbi:MAG TPA: mechanosensitive ion channel domain-containing protein [Geobacteraceae bacterium]
MDRIIELYRLQESDGFFLYWMKELIVALLIFAIFWGLARLLRYILTVWGPKLTSFTATDLDDRVLRRVTPPLSLLVIFGGLYLAVRKLPLPEAAHVAASGGVFVVNIIILTNIAYRATDEIINWYSGRVAERTGAVLNRQIMPLLEKLISIFLILTAAIITLKHFNYDILSLVTALGIGSLAIGMAAKDTLANMISGFTLMIDRPFRIGDRIQLASGQWGDVADIGLRSTKIRTVDNTLLIIPNSELCNTTIINLAFPDVRAKGKVSIGVAYGSDVEMVKKVMVATAAEIPEILADPAPEAFFVSFGESALNMALFFWAADYTLVYPLTDRVNTLLLSRLREHGIQVPYPTRTVMLENQVDRLKAEG